MFKNVDLFFVENNLQLFLLCFNPYFPYFIYFFFIICLYGFLRALYICVSNCRAPQLICNFVGSSRFLLVVVSSTCRPICVCIHIHIYIYVDVALFALYRFTNIYYRSVCSAERPCAFFCCTYLCCRTCLFVAKVRRAFNLFSNIIYFHLFSVFYFTLLCNLRFSATIFARCFIFVFVNCSTFFSWLYYNETFQFF